MKKNLMIVLCVALCASCAVKKPVQQPVQQSVQQILQEDDIIQLPCQEEAIDTEQYYAVLGVGSDFNLNFARQKAMIEAKRILTQKISKFGVSAEQHDISKMEYSGDLNDMEIVCQKVCCDISGNYVVYVAVRMPKNK